jgi:hypothetical protein
MDGGSGRRDMTEDRRQDEAAPPEAEPGPRRGYIPHPPSQAELDQISRDQALITDEWAGDTPGPTPGTSPGKEPPPG